MFKKFVAIILLVLLISAPANSAVSRKNRKYRKNSPLPQSSVKNLPPIILGQFYNVKIVLGDDGKISLNPSDLPQGLSFNPETGEISGTVTQANTDNIKLSAENAKGEVVKEFLLRVIK